MHHVSSQGRQAGEELYSPVDNDFARKQIVFDPIPRVDGIDTSGDPLSEVRSEIYLLSGRRRRAAPGK